MTCDLLMDGARLMATMGDQDRELPGCWIAITDGVVSAVGASADKPPGHARRLSARDCRVTPGLINTHHHLYQNLTRVFPPMISAPLFGRLRDHRRIARRFQSTT